MNLKDIRRSDKLMELRPVNPVVVSRYRQAMRQGAKFPPLKYDTEHNILIGGNHRYDAYLAEFGADYEPELQKFVCETWADVLEEFAKDNAKHGKPLEGFARRRVALALINEGRRAEDVARLFDVSIGRLESWGGQVVRVIGHGGGTKPVKHGVPEDPQPIYVSEYIHHATEDQGVSILRHARQIIAFAQRKWLRLEDEQERAVLVKLRDELNKVLE